MPAKSYSGTGESAAAKTNEMLLIPDLVYAFVPSGNQSKLQMHRSQFADSVTVEKADSFQRLAQTVEDLVKELGDASGDSSARSAMQQLLQSVMVGPEGSNSVGDVQAGNFGTALSMEQLLAVRTDSLRQTQAVLNDMLDRLKGDVTFDPKAQQAVIHLDPPALGRLQIQMNIDDAQSVVAVIQSDNRDTQDFLRQNQEELRRGLRDQGFDPDRSEIRIVDPEDLKFSWKLYDMLHTA